MASRDHDCGSEHGNESLRATSDTESTSSQVVHVSCIGGGVRGGTYRLFSARHGGRGSGPKKRRPTR